MTAVKPYASLPAGPVLRHEIAAETRHGLWALFLRASKKWRRPDRGGDPAGMSDWLRDELRGREGEILELAARQPAG